MSATSPARRGAGNGGDTAATYLDGRPFRAFVIADLDDGRRWVGTCDDAGFAEATAPATIGTTVDVTGAAASRAPDGLPDRPGSWSDRRVR